MVEHFDNIVLSLITILTMTTIAYCSDISHSFTYEGAVRTVCGTTAYRITAVTLAVHSFFSCVVILVIIGDQWKEIFLFVARDHYCIVKPWYMHKAYIGHLPIIPIYSCMTVRKLKTFCCSVTVAVFMCTVFYGLTGMFGYLTFGDSVTSNIFLSYEPSPEIFVGVLMLSLKTYTNYPIIAFSGREALLSLWEEFSEYSEEEKIECEKKRRIIISSIWFIMSLAFALYIPFIGIIVRYQGVLAFLFVLIYP
ncbi:hypothetical protein KUTeg_018964, partial [Tegillarca granosa]